MKIAIVRRGTNDRRFLIGSSESLEKFVSNVIPESANEVTTKDGIPHYPVPYPLELLQVVYDEKYAD